MSYVVPCTNAPQCAGSMELNDPMPDEEVAEAVECDECVRSRIYERTTGRSLEAPR